MKGIVICFRYDFRNFYVTEYLYIAIYEYRVVEAFLFHVLQYSPSVLPLS